MKIAVRALVLGMLIAGFAANHMLASNSTPTSKTTLVASASAIPPASCNLGTSCGL
ncbi:MAG: hypothetical protein ACYDC6_12195 [Acidobacteriaceae bacterium]